MNATPDDISEFRLYSSAQAAELVSGGEDGGLTKATFDALARSGQVKYTRIRRKIRWTVAQIAAAVAYCETAGGEEAKASAPAARSTVPAPPAQRGTVAPFKVRPGSRYATSTR
ncbi:hypothetical protein OHA25_08715 [Nonomuraea sp. NBC_00507]|uniref:hypothetical protein n=1 Tax=Nonomuraea sp. NBC_00507 TaxID=2976002 RepID=UPI002E19B45F